MDLSRQEYPAMLNSLQPAQAVELLNSRVHHISRINTEIADWLEERRRIEETYAQAMRKLARKHPPGSSSDLGIFLSPWKSIAASADALGESHFILAQKIEADVEKPLRHFANSNREMQSMSTIQGNLASLAKEFDSAHRKADKGKDRGASTVDDAYSQWASQAPFVYEQLQAVDESRCNHLRDVLTQLETHEADLVQRNRATAESCLNALLNIDTADEIKAFAVRHTGTGGPVRPESSSRQDSSRADRAPSRALPNRTPSMPMMQSMPGAFVDDPRSELPPEDKGEKKSRLSGIKRLGTVISRRRQSTLPLQSGSPATTPRATMPQESATRNLPSRDALSQSTPTRDPTSRNFNAGQSGSARERAPSPSFFPQQPAEQADETYAPPPGPPPGRAELSSVNGGGSPLPSPPTTNGLRSNMGQLQEPLQPQMPQATRQNPRDAEGYSVPPRPTDPISQAEQEAETESPSQQFNVNIRNAPIADNNADAEAAMANMAETLRAQSTPGRRTASVRGRREVRNTVFMDSPPVPQMPDNYLTQSTSSVPPVPQLSASPPAAMPTTTTTTSSGMILTPFLASLHGGQGLQLSPTTSNSQSVAESTTTPTRGPATAVHNSSSSTAGPTSQSASQPGHGLTTTIHETISCHIDHGAVTRTTVVGELSLSHTADSSFPGPSTHPIRLEHFQVLEKVAANPAFVQQTQGKPGEYNVNLTAIAGQMSTAFKYQVHVADDLAAGYAPILLAPTWKVEPSQTSVILAYSLNPAFRLNGAETLKLTNVVLAISLGEGAGTAVNCLSKPAGTFSKERNLIYWRLPEVTVRPGAQPERVLARFTTEGEATPGKVEARWEVTGPNSLSLGSGLDVSVLESSAASGSDPFADDDDQFSKASGQTWKQIEGTRKLVSGTYTAV